MDEKEIKLSLTNWLAIERTRLANERTFLAYFRTALAFLAGGVTILRLDAFDDIRWLGYVFLILAPLVLLVGIWRLVSVKREIERRYYHGVAKNEKYAGRKDVSVKNKQGLQSSD